MDGRRGWDPLPPIRPGASPSRPCGRPDIGGRGERPRYPKRLPCRLPPHLPHPPPSSSPGCAPPAVSSPRTRRGCSSPRPAPRRPRRHGGPAGRRPAARARPRLGGVLRSADRRGPRGLRPPPPHRVPRPRRPSPCLRAAPAAVVVDLCCGSGAVGAALAAALGRSSCTPPTSTRPRCACARRNLAAVGGRVYEGDLYEPLPAALRGRVDVLVANAPYVPTEAIGLLPPEARVHEPRVALDGGADGLDVLRRVAAAAPRWLAPGGHLLIETSERQAPHTAEAFAARAPRAGGPLGRAERHRRHRDDARLTALVRARRRAPAGAGASRRRRASGAAGPWRP